MNAAAATILLLSVTTTTTTAFQGLQHVPPAQPPRTIGRRSTTPLPASTLEPETKQKDRNGRTQQQPTKQQSLQDRFASSSMASAAAVATAAVNAAVSMKTLEAPDTSKSYVTLDRNTEIDADGLPLTYDKDAIQAYWTSERGALNQRWREFVGKAVPFFTKLVTLLVRDGEIAEKEIPGLSRQARMDLQDLGPTFIKAGQMMSVSSSVVGT